MNRLILVVLACVVAGLSVSADDPKSSETKKPQWQRMLTGEDARKAEKLNVKMYRLAFVEDDYAGAIKAAEELLVLRTKLQGGDHYEAANLKHEITVLRKVAALPAEKRDGWWSALIGAGEASKLEAQSQYAKALPKREVMLKWCRDVLGEEHPYTAANYNNVAGNLSEQGKHAEAQPLYRKALEIRKKALGEEHPATAASYNNVASNLNAQGKLVEAQPLYRKALEIRKRVLGEEHPHTAASYNNVAFNLNAQGQFAEAQPLYEKALEIHRKVLGEEHPSTATSYNNVAFNLGAQGKHAEARPLYRKALEIRKKALGEEHPATAEAYQNVAANLGELGKHVEAQPLFQRSLELYRKLLGEESPETALSYSNLAYTLNAQGKPLEAQPLYQKALEISRKVLGEEHPGTASIGTNSAINLADQGKFVEAKAVLERAIHSYESSRLAGASGLDRASLSTVNPRRLLAALQHPDDPNEAWRSAELSLARGLLDHQATRFASTLKADEQAQQTELRERIAILQPQILSLVTKANRTAAEVATLQSLLQQRRDAGNRLATLAAKISQRQVADPDAIRKAMPADAALLLWVDVASDGGIQEHWLCVVRPTGDAKWERLPGTGAKGKWTADDSDLPWKFRTALARSAPQAEVDALAKRLHAQRIAPGLKHLGGVKTLYVVPVSPMAGIPLELLVPNMTVSYVPSGTYLARAKAQPSPKGRQLLALGDPIFKQPGEKPPLPAKLPPGGLLITQVIPGSTAAKARLEAGDVILKYGKDEVKDFNGLVAAIAANAKADSVPVTVWRESADKPFVRDIAPGQLGVVLHKDPAPVAISSCRRTDALLLSLHGGGWKDLPGTRVEIDTLRRMLGKDCVTLTDGAASEQNLDALRKSGELSKFRYLHFATHGEGNAARAFESALILAQDKLPKDPISKPGEPFINGRLSALEVLEFWKLDAELVTLSACETAVGKAGGGDGSLGFAQAFLTAGSRSVCLTLWTVDDVATVLLIDRFYQNLLVRKMGKAAALDEAKRWLRNLSGEDALALTAKLSDGVIPGARGVGSDLKPANPADPKLPPTKDSKPFAHPKYWAAFVLVGDPN